MSEDIAGIIGVIITVFVVLLLGYVFLMVFWQLNPALAILFAIIIGIIILAMIAKVLGGR